MPESWPRRTIVTRAAPDAERWVAALQELGVAALALPLLAIRPLSAPALRQGLQAARERWRDYQALMFVSGNAVRHFFESNSAQTLAAHAQAAIKTRYWAPGPGTVRALRACGVPAALIDGPDEQALQFDSEALWQQVAPQIGPGARVLIVRGTSEPHCAQGQGRDWLAQRLAAAGAQVDRIASYERCAPPLDEGAQALVRAAARDGSLWLFSSSEALGHLPPLPAGQDWSGARALATHPRIAQAARRAGFGQVRDCRPALADVAASIKSWHEH
ncbi:uroporphyrinogen-III synthase [Comamonas sp. NLF-1-9]|uniref:uroporphyrinogen-III synthase n=1 Tax=Comamonas sp. NLF-1-9 TaxID=2853163 RepID=UPI001C47AD6F|nr:uroporphyrinogen-III synthase [Comamonas sp. NLF-1-9]QXL85512.1 uroporphyrinogen-III synthase [Comamonas sp. NLF-1-9]